MSSAELTNDDRINSQPTEPNKPFVLSKSYVQGLLQPRLCHCCSAWLPHLAPHGCLRLFSTGKCKSSCLCALPSALLPLQYNLYFQEHTPNIELPILSAVARLACCPHMQWHELSSAQAMLSMLASGQPFCCRP